MVEFKPQDPYEPKVNEMPAFHGTVSWDLFKTVVTILLAAIGTLMWFYLSGMRADLNALRSDLFENVSAVRRDLSDTRVEFTKAIGNVEKEVAITNGKLDTTNAKLGAIVSELQRTRRH